ncbi:M28 family peptidase [Microdochium nivale]|nr:M28 family peptidase [Microdochium nivale]
MGAYNPIGFRPFQVSFWTTVVYIAILVPLIFVHETVPTPPADTVAYAGLDLTKAWSDLLTLTRAYHPYNSRENDKLHDWLLLELEAIQKKNGAAKSDFVIFDDNISNVTAYQRTAGSTTGTATYFEGTNIVVYIRGKDDPEGQWWDPAKAVVVKNIGKGGVLINAHYDSVSTGFGATDDGMGCATVLSMVDYFSRSENQPQRGIVALLNNNEEDWLWGAQAFGYHPTMPFCHTFLNLEGAGAGGRATIFRTTDAQVTSAYKSVRHPFGTVISSDAFGLGVIRSGTDFSIFVDSYGLRGLDMAFYRPRARYHTNQDDAKHASRASLWHMMSNALDTMKALSGDTGETFIGERADGDTSKVDNGQGTTGVWFDIFGRAFAVFDLKSFFAWSLTLLIAGPLILLITTYIIARSDKYYFFSSRILAYEGSVPDPIQLGGRKGIIRFPFALIVSSALTVGAAYLLAKINPLVVYSNEYTVWAMMLSLFFFAFWTIMAGANFARPSALSRGYAIIWIYAISWLLLVMNTVLEDRYAIAGGYLFVFLNSAAFLAVLLALLEQYGLPTKLMWALQSHPDHHVSDDHLNSVPHRDGPSSGAEGHNNNEESSEATETTPLFGANNKNNNSHHQTTFGGGYRQRDVAAAHGGEHTPNGKEPYEHEQSWSTDLPSWLWFLQFLLLGPFLLIIIGQSALLIVSSVSQTGVDGSSTLVPYLMAAFFSILLVLPVTPFVHRISHHVPLFLLMVFAATLIYNLVVFPFTEDSRAKIYFQQNLNLDTGFTDVIYSGVREYVDLVIDELPSAMGKKRNCTSSSRSGLTACAYDGSVVLPNVVPGTSANKQDFAGWITFNITRASGDSRARFAVDAQETKSCLMTFDKRLSGFHIHGANKPDERFGAVPEDGISAIGLYRRDWATPWEVDVRWDSDSDENTTGMDGHIDCYWADVNTPGTIPAYDEGLQYAPTWAALTKFGKGLVVGSKAFKA